MNYKTSLILSTILLLSSVSNAQFSCSYDNTFYQTISTPTTLNQTITSSCVYGGEFVTINLQAGRTYYINTCGNTNFDTQISIFTSGGNLECAYNDDYCGVQSGIYFTPLTTGNYDILIDEFNCLSNNICMDLNVTLWNIPRADITIPVVFHVVYNNPNENISDAQIYSQIDVLNQVFNRTDVNIYNVPSPFLGASMDPMLQFCLAVRDPNGNPTSGITRTYTPVTSFNVLQQTWCNSTQCILDSSLGGQSPWDPNKYLNIWVCNMTGTTLNGYIGIGLGPMVPPPAGGLGITTDYRAIGTNGAAQYPVNQGRNVVHEVGHYLNLWHLWGADNNSGVCSSDSVFDTPMQDLPSVSIPNFPLTDGCTNAYPGIQFQNFMDYSHDPVRNMFTYGQVVRMDETILGPFYSLASSNGCTPGAATNANFTANVTTGIAPLSVNFNDLSTNSPTSWNWSFYGGATPSTSNLQNPTGITWNSPGLKNVKLVASNAWGSDTEIKTNYINVVSGAGLNEPDYIFQLFPNPTTGILNISSSIDKIDVSVEIISLLGQSLINKEISIFNGENYSIDISNLQNGIYFVRFDGQLSRIIKE
jgi:hypothetical protein